MEGNNSVNDLLEQRAAAGTGAGPTVTETVMKQSATNLWGNITPEFEAPPKPKEETPPVETTGTATATQQKPPTPAGLPEKLLRDSAELTVSVIEAPVKVVGGAALWYQLNQKGKKAFASKEEWERAVDLVEADLDPADEREKNIKKKMARLVRKHNEKMDSLPFTEAERSTMAEGFYQKYKIEQKTMDPNLMVYCSIIAAIGTRSFDIATGW